ncbi:hypothetical protein Agub_g6071, partial [Astrephomene gubernaculifera]
AYQPGSGATDAAAAPQGLVSSGASAAVPPPGSLGSGELDAWEVVRVLQLQRLPSAEGEGGSWLDSGELGGGPWTGRGQATTLPLCCPPGRPPAGPQLVWLEPRVVALAGGRGQGQQHLTLKAVVRTPSGTSSSPLELLVRAEGRYLPATVTPANTPTTSTSATAATHDDGSLSEDDAAKGRLDTDQLVSYTIDVP